MAAREDFKRYLLSAEPAPVKVFAEANLNKTFYPQQEQMRPSTPKDLPKKGILKKST